MNEFVSDPELYHVTTKWIFLFFYFKSTSHAIIIPSHKLNYIVNKPTAMVTC